MRQDLVWRLLSEDQLREMYDRELGRDFPAAELRPCADAAALVRRGAHRPWGVYTSAADGTQTLCAYLFLAGPAAADGPVLLDYFGVLPAWRASGLGGVLLAELARRENRAILIESELPDRAPDPDMARRRLGFYGRCGALMTPFWDRAFQGWFQVMVLCAPGEDPARRQAEAGADLAAIYRQLMPDAVYARHFAWGTLPAPAGM